MNGAPTLPKQVITCIMASDGAIRGINIAIA